jgi:hypothetical protein
LLRLRRNPTAGLTLLAILTPLIAAGPGMPCAGADSGHHRAVGHVADASTGADGHADAHGPHHSHGHSGTAGHGAETEAAPAPDDAPAPASPASCTMGMLCSGTVLTPPAATLASAAVVHETPGAERRWTLHTADPTLPRRPPRA